MEKNQGLKFDTVPANEVPCGHGQRGRPLADYDAIASACTNGTSARIKIPQKTDLKKFSMAFYNAMRMRGRFRIRVANGYLYVTRNEDRK